MLFNAKTRENTSPLMLTFVCNAQRRENIYFALSKFSRHTLLLRLLTYTVCLKISGNYFACGTQRDSRKQSSPIDRHRTRMISSNSIWRILYLTRRQCLNSKSNNKEEESESTRRSEPVTLLIK